ncbi:MAG: response regulator [Deltaproteobacteria bacterium]|nr:MAG: response regulator [Deltaproteobacteria bacterium]
MKKRVLVVDDDPKHLLTTRDLLELSGYEVAVHNTPFRTTEIVQTWKPDLVLLDVNMPGLAGDRLCGLVRANGNSRNVLIMLHSSNDEESLRESARHFAADGYICKGDIAGLRRKVAAALGC